MIVPKTGKGYRPFPIYQLPGSVLSGASVLFKPKDWAVSGDAVL